jgi:DNA repair protein RadC
MTATLAQKLQIKSGKLIVINAPTGYAELLTTELKHLTVSTRAAGLAEAVLLFVNSLAQVEKLAPKAIQAVKPDGMLWLAYAKGTSKVKTDVNRDKLWEMMKPTGWQAVRSCASNRRPKT